MPRSNLLEGVCNTPSFPLVLLEIGWQRRSTNLKSALGKLFSLSPLQNADLEQIIPNNAQLEQGAGQTGDLEKREVHC